MSIIIRQAGIYIGMLTYSLTTCVYASTAADCQNKFPHNSSQYNNCMKSVQSPSPASKPAPPAPAKPVPVATQTKPRPTYEVNAPSKVSKGQSIDFVVNVSNGTLGTDAYLSFEGGDFKGRSGTKFSFIAISPGTKNWDLRDKKGGALLKNGQITIAEVAPPPAPKPATPPSEAKNKPSPTYSVSAPSSAHKGQTIEFQVAVSNGNLPSDAYLNLDGGEFKGKSGNKFTFVASSAGTKNWELRDKKGGTLLRNGQITVADVPTSSGSYSISSVTSLPSPLEVGKPVTFTVNGNVPQTMVVDLSGEQCDNARKPKPNQVVCQVTLEGDKTVSVKDKSGGTRISDQIKFKSIGAKGSLNELEGKVRAAIPSAESAGFEQINIYTGGPYPNPLGHGYCTDYAKKIFKEVSGSLDGIHGNAKDMVTNAKSAGWKTLSGQDIDKAPAGALIVWHGPFGHVGVVVSNDGKTLTITEANAGNSFEPNRPGHAWRKSNAITERFNKHDERKFSYKEARSHNWTGFGLAGFVIPQKMK